MFMAACFRIELCVAAHQDSAARLNHTDKTKSAPGIWSVGFDPDVTSATARPPEDFVLVTPTHAGWLSEPL